MQKEADTLQAFERWLVAPIGYNGHAEEPPSPVPSLIAGLIDPLAIRAAVAIYDGRGESKTTLWTVYAVTDVALAYVEVVYDQPDYTSEVQRDVPKYHGKYATAEVRAAWVRPLNRIAELTIIDRRFTDEGRATFAAKVLFAGVAEPVSLPDQTSIYNEQQLDQSDALLRVIRDAIGR